LVTLPKSFWPRVLGSVVIKLYAGERTPSVDQTLTKGVARGPGPPIEKLF